MIKAGCDNVTTSPQNRIPKLTPDIHIDSDYININ